jgi:hypothetical protein
MTIFPLLASSTFTLSFAESVFLLIGLIVIAIAVSIWVYRRTVPEVSKGLRVTLIVFRSLALAVLLFILFQPVLNLEESISIEPKIAIIYDNSKSMTVEDAGTSRSDILRTLADSDELSRLDDDEHRFYLLGQSAYPLQEFELDSLTFLQSETNISDALQKIHDDLKEENLRAIVLASDGVVTRGKNPLYTAEALGLPVYTIGIGDSTEKKDVLVADLMANAVAYVDNVVPVEVTVRSAGFNEGTVKVALRDGNTTIDTKSLELKSGGNEYPLAFEYIPKSEGSKKLTVSISSLPGELTQKNNSQSAFMKVLKTKMKVAVIAGAPSADVSLFQQLLRKDENVEPAMFIQKTSSSWYGDPPNPKALEEADCIVLIGFPLNSSPGAILQSLRKVIEESSKPLFIVLSRNCDIRRLESTLGSSIPLQSLQIRNNENEVFIEPSEANVQNPIVRTGIENDAWAKLPPLFKTEAGFKLKVGATVLATMKINSVVFNEPVIVTRKVNRQRVLMSTAYGFWRWQLAWDVMDGRVPEMLVSNAVRWLTSRENEKQVRISPVKEFFDSSEPIAFQAQVYDESYEPVNNATVDVLIQTSDGDRELILNPLGNGFYRGVIEQLGEGDYSYSGTASNDGNAFGKDRGRFSVGELNREFINTRTDTKLLRQIAGRSGGRYFPADDIDGLADAVLNSEDFVQEENIVKSDIQIWNLLLLLGIAVLFFAIEWFLRKQSGMI